MSKTNDLMCEFTRLFALIEDEEMDEETLLDTLEGMEGELQERIEALVWVQREKEAKAKQMKEEKEFFAKKQKVLENSAKRVKDYIELVLKNVGYTELETDHFKVKFQKNPASVEVDENILASEIPIIYQKITVDFDKSAIKQALKDGEKLDFAKLVQTEGIRIR